MEWAGILMLLAVPVVLVATGLPAYLVLIAISTIAAFLGIASGALSLSLLSALPGRVVNILENDLLQAIPLFVLMGVLLNRLPLAGLLFDAARTIFARSPAGSRLAGFALGALLAPMNGSVGASVATLTNIVTPRLREQGETPESSQSLVCVASTLGVVIPPSLVLILLGDAMLRAHTEALNVTGMRMRIINTQDIFHGALFPAAMFLLACFAIILWQGRGGKPGARMTLRIADIAGAAATLICVGGLLAGTTAGYIYAVEGAAIGTFVLLVGGIATRRLDLATLRDVLRVTMATTGALFALFLAATGFTLLFRMFGTPALVETLFAAVPGGTQSAMFAGLLTIGAFAFVLDAFEIIFVVVPILMPPLLVRVPDATWAAILTLLALQASFLIPPFGFSAMLARSLSREPVSAAGLARRILPFLGAQLTVAAIVFAWPQTVHWNAAPALTPPAAEDGQNIDIPLDIEPVPTDDDPEPDAD